jgi:hypothetical protein
LYNEVDGFDSHIGIRAWVVVFLTRYGYSNSAGKLRILTWWCYRVWPTWGRRSRELDFGALAPKGGQEGTFAHRKRAEGSQNKITHRTCREPTFHLFNDYQDQKKGGRNVLETRN